MPVLGNHTAEEREAFIEDYMARNPGSGKTMRTRSKGKKVGAGKPMTYHAVRRQKAARKWSIKVRKELANAEKKED
jgi:hypothetical protein